MYKFRKSWVQFLSLYTLSTRLPIGYMKGWVFIHVLLTKNWLVYIVSKQPWFIVLPKLQVYFYTQSTNLTNTTKLNKGLL